MEKYQIKNYEEVKQIADSVCFWDTGHYRNVAQRLIELYEMLDDKYEQHLEDCECQ